MGIKMFLVSICENIYQRGEVSGNVLFDVMY